MLNKYKRERLLMQKRLQRCRIERDLACIKYTPTEIFTILNAQSGLACQVNMCPYPGRFGYTAASQGPYRIRP